MPKWGASHSGCSNAQSGDVALALIGNLDAEQLKAPAICTAQNPSGRELARFLAANARVDKSGIE
jgi:hypothetical protein